MKYTINTLCMALQVFAVCFLFLEVYCTTSFSHAREDNVVKNDGPCMDVTKSYVLPRHNPVKVTRRKGLKFFNNFIM